MSVLDFTEALADFTLIDVLEAQRCVPDAETLVVSPESKRSLYDLLSKDSHDRIERGEPIATGPFAGKWRALWVVTADERTED